MRELIDRQEAVDALKICDANYDGTNCDKCPLRDERWNGAWYDDETDCHTKLMRDSAKLLEMSSAQPERLTDDDFETIRIHLNAFKENLCNQRRWKEAEEYQRIIDRFMAFASAQPCKGKWIDYSDEGYVECPFCHSATNCDGNKDELHYCFSCGAELRGDLS